jgi:spore maturation protein CgeB
VRASEGEKKLLERVKRETGRPDFVFIHVTSRYLEPTMGGWRSIGIPPVGILNAADTFLYHPTPVRPEMACDAMMCGGYWAYKSRNLDRFVLPLCDSGRKVRLYGSQLWPTPSYVGYLEDDEVRAAMCSAKVCLNVHEPHSTRLGFDVVTRPFSALACGRACLSDYVEELASLFKEDELVLARTPQEYREKLEWLLEDEPARLALGAAGQSAVLESHTYFDRVSQMLESLGMKSEAAAILEGKAHALS